MRPEDIELHGVETSKGSWGIFVQSAVKARDDDNLFLTIVLERNIDEEHIETRRLTLLLFSRELKSDTGRKGILREIRCWIDTTDGDGSLDLASKSS